VIVSASTHTVGAFAIILDDASRILLCHRTDRDMWNLPGGRVEANESPWDAVLREVAEEVGLLVRVDRLFGVYSVLARADLVLNFLCAPAGGAIRLSDEADAIQWFSRADIPPNTLPRQCDRIGDAFDHLQETILKTQV
jgi:ADP-ribose pyrophosphatase YjhB (NUDIX family)